MWLGHVDVAMQYVSRSHNDALCKYKVKGGGKTWNLIDMTDPGAKDFFFNDPVLARVFSQPVIRNGSGIVRDCTKLKGCTECVQSRQVLPRSLFGSVIQASVGGCMPFLVGDNPTAQCAWYEKTKQHDGRCGLPPVYNGKKMPKTVSNAEFCVGTPGEELAFAFGDSNRVSHDHIDHDVIKLFCERLKQAEELNSTAIHFDGYYGLPMPWDSGIFHAEVALCDPGDVIELDETIQANEYKQRYTGHSERVLEMLRESRHGCSTVLPGVCKS